MYLLDTNVISELRRQKPHGAVMAWLRTVDDKDLFISVVSLAEIQAGIEKTRDQDPDKANDLEIWADGLAASFNILSMDAATFRLWARLMHRRSDAVYEDAMIAATAIIYKIIVVTRNIKDFADYGIESFDPFKFKP
jgi:predicted nucleic acid-binding protein